MCGRRGCSVFSSQFYCKPKIALKIKSLKRIFKETNRVQSKDIGKVTVLCKSLLRFADYVL